MSDIITLKLDGLGYREIGMAAELLLEYTDKPPAFLGYGADGLTLGWNPDSDLMWLETEEYVTGVLEEGEDGKNRIVQFFNCSQCGYEGTQKTALASGYNRDFEKYEGYCSAKCAKENDVEVEDEDEKGSGRTLEQIIKNLFDDGMKIEAEDHGSSKRDRSCQPVKSDSTENYSTVWTFAIQYGGRDDRFELNLTGLPDPVPSAKEIIFLLFAMAQMRDRLITLFTMKTFQDILSGVKKAEGE